MTLVAHRAPAHEFTRGPTHELLVVAQRNIAATSVRFDLGWGWREHICRAARSVYVVPAEAPARWRLDAESQCVFLAIDAGPVPGLLDELGVSDPADGLWTLAARGFEEALVHELIERLWAHARRPEGCPSLLADSYRVAIVHALWRRVAGLRAVDRRPQRARLPRPQLRRVLDYIDAHLCEPLAVAQLAAVAGTSVFHFSRLFREATGQPPWAFVTEQRLAHAADRLRHGEEPVAHIARVHGFGSASQFSRAFAQRYSCPPLRYRRQWGSGGARDRDSG